MLIAVILLQGCSKSFDKTYKIKFDKLLMSAFEQNFSTPSSLRDCRMEIKTDEEYDITQYCNGSWMFQSHWGFSQSDEENGFFYVPNLENCDITLYNDATNAKYFELSCRDGEIRNIFVYDEDKNIICEAEGLVECDFMYDEASCYFFTFGHRVFYDYSQEGQRYKSKEETTKLYEETEEYSIYKLTITEYYQSGDASHTTSHICITAKGDAESYSHIIEDSYWEETISDEPQKGEMSSETNSTDLEPWMVGTWKGKLNNGYMQLYWSLEIDKYGNATQIIYNPQGDSEVELLSLKYNRDSEQLYYKDGGMAITIQVDSYNKTLSLPSSSGTLYLYKENAENNNSYSSSSPSDYIKEEEQDEPNHPRWCFGSWRIMIDDVNVMIADIHSSGVDIKVMRGFTIADSEKLKNWTVEDGMLYMYNGANKYGSYSFMVDERNKVLYHNGRAMEKH